MKDKVVVDLMRRIIDLEERVLKLEEGKDNTNVLSKEISRDSNKYRYLSRYLLNSNQETVRLTFSEIERISNVSLPNSAYRHRAFWSNTETHSISLSWMSVGYKVSEVNLIEKYVIFDKK